ncbi:MAG: SpoIIE family protein phosphatase [Anaerolineae bacterium]|nr:SpoIIE family protein phosphatase [Anaerolineae bacterium]
MLDLSDFFHLPELDPLIDRLVNDVPGLIVVAGLDAQHASAQPGGLLPSGHNMIVRILMRRMLVEHTSARAVVVSERRHAFRVPRQLRDRVESVTVEHPRDFPARIAGAARRWPDLLVVDTMSSQTTPAILDAVGAGVRVLAQLNTVFRGAAIARVLRDQGVSHAQLGDVRWMVTVQRFSTLCAHCRKAVALDPEQAALLARRFPAFEVGATFFAAPGCPHCGGRGRQGDVAAFDVFRGGPETEWESPGPSVLPLSFYMLRLARDGYLTVEDVLSLDTEQLQRTFSELTVREAALATTRAELERKVAELEAANRVLEQRTEALMSLQDVSRALTAATSLDDLAARICRYARGVCAADRVVLYYLRSPDTAEVLAMSGWGAVAPLERLDAMTVCGVFSEQDARPYEHLPPGISFENPQLEARQLHAGLCVPLIAQEAPVGAMFVHATRKDAFKPGAVALLQAFADQAAVAIQRAGLIEELHAKIVALEAAQEALVQKERLERELDLARQVQQSVLPRSFPDVPGLSFAACNVPARQVGGDLYDVVALDARRVGVVIADVSDKGMPAALYMGLTRSLILAEAQREHSPRAVLVNVNRLLRMLGSPDMFVSVFYGVIDVVTRELTYVRAGHDWPFLVRSGETHLLRGEGAVLGYWDEIAALLSEETTALQPGDRLVLYTDGLTDVAAPDGALYDRDRLRRLLQGLAGESPDVICDATFERLDCFRDGAEQLDDMTLLVVAVA